MNDVMEREWEVKKVKKNRITISTRFTRSVFDEYIGRKSEWELEMLSDDEMRVHIPDSTSDPPRYKRLR